MGGQPPYLYDAPRRESAMGLPTTFNPKAVTMASRQPPPSPKKKQEGPFISFNQHPDSFLILPYGNTNVKSMSPKTKIAVKVVRWIQFVLRLLSLFGALGVVLCAIFIRGATDTEGYIMRIAPGVDIVFALYAIYHLLRKPTSRPAASSASYHFFALVMDAGFLPFYVFTALLAKRNWDEEAGTSGRWRTFFPTDEETNKVLITTWLTAFVVAGLHCLSLFLDIWLTLIFRKISSLPPDMNPLEDNLTSRRKTKHKHKNSSISAITPLTHSEKRFSAKSSLSDSVNSQADPLMGDGGIPSPERKQMQFMHTRADSNVSYSPHTPTSAHQARDWLPKHQAEAPIRMEFNTRDDLLRRDEPKEESLAERRAMLAQQAIKRSSRPSSVHSMSSRKTEQGPPPPVHRYDPSGDIGLQKDHENMGTNHWFVNDEPSSMSRPQQPAPKPSLFPSKKSGYMTINAYDDVSDEEIESPMLPKPLRMNPPSPPPSQSYEEPASKEHASPPQTPSPLKRTQTVNSVASDETYNFSSPTRASSRSPTKSRYYGDLKAAQQGIIKNTPSPTSRSPVKIATPTFPSAVKQYTSNVSPSSQPKHTSSPFSLDRKNFPKVKRTVPTAQPNRSESPRVVSRSGVDYDGRMYDDLSDLGTPGRRRDVSGKIAEEGRGGGGLAERWGAAMNDGQGLTYRKVSGLA